MVTRRTLKIFAFLFWALFESMRVVCAPAVSDIGFYKNYPYIFILDDGVEPQPLSDEQFFDSSAKVLFPVGKTLLPSDSQLLRELESAVIPQINRDSLQIMRMVFRGAASPEGPRKFNEWLGEQRAKRLFDWVSSRMTFPVTDHSVIEVGAEDYGSLCLMMLRAHDPDYGLVKELCDRYGDSDPAGLKRALQAARHGSLWRRLLKDYFPSLRSVRFVIFLKKVAPPTPPQPVVQPILLPVVPPVVLPVEQPVMHPVDTIVPIEPVVEVGRDTAEIVVPSPVIADTAIVCDYVVEPRRELLSVKTNLLFYGVYMPGYNRWCPIPNVALEYYPKGGHFTFGASFDMPWWQDYDAHKYFQLRNYQIESRYYFRANGASGSSGANGASGSFGSSGANGASGSSGANGASGSSGANGSQGASGGSSPAFRGFYLQVYGHLGLYGICFDADRGWVGEGFGGGLGFGYVMPLTKNGHWRLEFQLQAGFFRTKYDPYKYENPINPDYHDDLYYYKWTLDPGLFKKRQYRWNWLGPTRIGVTLSYDLLYRRNHKSGFSLRNKERSAGYER